jgi:class 3 adenylate cyclase/tetratricopeptide (TPR) repeat protein
MTCPRCRAENSAQARFCANCGARLVAACTACGTPVSLAARFCSQCGQPVGPEPAIPARFASPGAYTPAHIAEKIRTGRTAVEGERKQVTVLFADLKGAAELLADRDPEESRALLDPVLTLMMDAVHQYEGTVNQVLADGIMALFGAPLAHEDHAVRACYAALRMQESARRYADEVRRSEGVPIQVAVGINSGEVVVRTIATDLHMDYTAIGQTTHLAGRMQQMATPGSILVTSGTLALVQGYVETRPLGPMRVRGLETTVEVHELTGAGRERSRLQAAVSRGLTPFVGRAAELARLAAALEQARAGRGQVVALVGDPGVGKSRLVYEFRRSEHAAGWRTLAGGSALHRRAAAYVPVIELLRSFSLLEPDDPPAAVREKLTAAVLGVDAGLRPLLPPLLALLDVPVDDAEWRELEPQQRRQRTFDAVRRLLLRASQREPLLVIVEDLQWIDAETQALLDGLVDAVGTARLVLLVTYRPEYRHLWAGKGTYLQVRLDTLAPDRADVLLKALLGDEPGLAPLKALLVARTGGNPLFLEESVRALLDTGALGGADGAYRLLRPIETIQVPATVQAILAARMDRLPPDEKWLLQSASVIGRDVPLSLLQALADIEEEPFRRGLARLLAGEFLHEASLFPEIQYRFKHSLTQEVAYGALVHERRRGLHARLVELLERQESDLGTDQTALLAHHATRGELWDKAVAAHRRAATRAARRSAYQEAVACLEQARHALQHLPETPTTRELAIDLSLELHTALIPLGDLGRMLETVREAEALAGSLGDQGRLARAAAYMSQCLWWMGHPDEAVDMGERALAMAVALGDRALEAVASLRLAQAHTSLGDFQRAVDAFRRNVVLVEALPRGARRGPDPRIVLPRAWTAWGLSYLGELDEAAAAAAQALREAEEADHALSLATAYAMSALPHLCRGYFGRAISLLERSLDISRREHFLPLYLLTAGDLGQAYALTGQVADAVALLEEAVARSASVRIVTTQTFTETWLAEAYGLAGRIDDAERAARRSLERTRTNHQRWLEGGALRVLGDILMCRARPELTEAEACYRGAVEIAGALGMRPWRGRSLLSLGRFQRHAGQLRAAETQLAAAAAIFRELGMSFWLDAAEAELRQVRPAAMAATPSAS